MSRMLRIVLAIASAVTFICLGAPEAGASTTVAISAGTSSSFGRSCSLQITGDVGTGGTLGTTKNVSFESKIGCNVANVSYLKLVYADVDVFITDHTTGKLQYSSGVRICQQYNWINCTASGNFSQLLPGTADYVIYGTFELWGHDATEVWTSYPDTSSYYNRIGCYPRANDDSFLTCYGELHGTF